MIVCVCDRCIPCPKTYNNHFKVSPEEHDHQIFSHFSFPPQPFVFSWVSQTLESSHFYLALNLHFCSHCPQIEFLSLSLSLSQSLSQMLYFSLPSSLTHPLSCLRSPSLYCSHCLFLFLMLSLSLSLLFMLSLTLRLSLFLSRFYALFHS